ncbi:hypothetical protein VTN49DRAFT_7506 [Thermomyces lanuginosus]|uniref:uncharacterized protein n=1 Tax=Thermomyces lanuginosus TaxID=5541 RepID=UPI003743218F
MRFFRAAAVLSLLYPSFAELARRTYDTHDFFALHLDDATSPEQVAKVLGARHEGPIGNLPNHHKFSVPRERSGEADDLLETLRVRRRLRRRGGAEASQLERRADGMDGVLWSQKLEQRQRLVKRSVLPRELSADSGLDARGNSAVVVRDRIASDLSIKDPIFKDQWHLFNTEQVGHDLNVTGVWLEGITGEGVVTAIVDDGLDMNSEDLKDNYFPEGSWDFNEDSNEPRPRLFDDRHGTRCAGEVAAVRNGVCGVGVAYESKVAGIRILSKPIDDADEAAAVNYGFQKNHIYSCSWGPRDDGKTMEAPGILVRRAIANGVVNGRDGKGSIFVFAAGNGASLGDNCNFDGYTNSIYSVTVGAIDRKGNHPAYSEACSAQLVVTYSSGSGSFIHTTDVGANACTNGHSGTSAASPLAAGAIALALSVRPDLTWRDVQYLLVETAVPVPDDNDDVQTTKIGKQFSHQYGYGKIDTYALVQKAKNWTLVPPQAWYTSPWLRVDREIPQGNRGLASYFEITEDMLKEANLAGVEHVTVTMNVNHTRRGDLSAELRSPEGVVSHLSVPRERDNAEAGYVDWTFMTVAHWGESGIGSWTVIVKDTKVNEFTGNFIDWRITLWGYAIDAAKQKPHPLPEEDDDEHTAEDAIHATVTVDPPPIKTPAVSSPEDHADRPSKPSPTPADSENTSEADAAETSPSSNFLPSFLPTFGVGPRTQVWIYASLVLIVVFCTCLGVYFYIQRRRRLRNNPRDDYEFDIVNDVDDDAAPLAGAGGRRRRGGELYNAFASESDEELLSGDDDDRDSSSDDGRYHDRPDAALLEKSHQSSST